MIELYTWPTPNGHKIHIMLEEAAIPYRVHSVNIRTGEQFAPEFLNISPNNRIPAIIDPEGPHGAPLALFESGAILLYLAEKSGCFMPQDTAHRFTCLQWLMWQMGGVGPMFGQANHFRRYAKEQHPYAIERYTNEANRLMGILDLQLGKNSFIAGEEFTIADMAIFPWTRHADQRGIDMLEYPHAQRWFDAINARPAVQRALQVLAAESNPAPINDATRDIMFGHAQFQKRSSGA
jgi:GST-like protein